VVNENTTISIKNRGERGSQEEDDLAGRKKKRKLMEKVKKRINIMLSTDSRRNSNH